MQRRHTEITLIPRVFTGSLCDYQPLSSNVPANCLPNKGISLPR